MANNISGEDVIALSSVGDAPSKRTLLQLIVMQDRQLDGRLNILVDVYDDLVLSNIWIKRRDSWTKAAPFNKAVIAEQGAKKHRYRASIVMQALFDIAEEIVPQCGESTGKDYDFYIEVSSSERKPSKYAECVRINSTGGANWFYPLGRAKSTILDDFSTISNGDNWLAPFINHKGFLAVKYNGSPIEKVAVRNKGLDVIDGVLMQRGGLVVRGGALSSARLVVIGRASDYAAEAHVRLSYRRKLSERRFGVRYYQFTAEYDFNSDIKVIGDGVADLYLDLRFVGSEGVMRKRIGKSSAKVRENVARCVIKDDVKALSIVSYYTYKGKNPSLQFESFNRDDYDYLDMLLDNRSKRPRRNREVWLIGEMTYKAQDNGLRLFQYMRRFHREVDAFYVLDKSSADARNLHGYDNVLDYRSKAHIDVIFRATRIIGTQQVLQQYPSRDPRLVKYLQRSAVHVFLQHGITAAKWIEPYAGRKAHDFYADIVMVASEREREFFIYDCGYKPEQVKVCGFARFDKLFEGDVEVKNNQLFVMPTWRPWLQDPQFFPKSIYFSKWMGFLTGDLLKDLVKRFQLDVVFCLHPNMRQYAHLFQGVGARVVLQGEVDIQYLLKQSNIMVTDYSSTAFDFAFLHKPVIFFQFDADRFELPHADPFTELPGPVVNTGKEVAKELNKILERSSSMDAEYRRRADKFVMHRDTNNCERTFQVINNVKNKTLTSLVRNLWSDKLAELFVRFRASKYYIAVMRRLYLVLRLLPVRDDVIVFESDLARRFADSPRAIYDRLVERGDHRLKVIVSKVRPRTRDENTIVVSRHSPAFIWYMARAKYWVNNNNFPFYIRRKKKGVFIQAWHGTPLKKMFLDQENYFGRDPGYIKRVKKMAKQWSVVVSPNAHTSAALKSAYGFNGPCLEVGYPRNDILVGPKKDSIRKSVRHELGLADNSYAILYAPTFRDDMPTEKGRFGFDWPFPVDEFCKAVGTEVVLLVRTHQLVNTKLKIPDGLRGNVRDVSAYEDIQRLFLASDMLITDYSSSFFDYALLRRPILFFAYDLEKYRDKLRGFYLDYESSLPGQVVKSFDELIEAINQCVADEHTDQTLPSDEFVLEFGPRNDGRASDRVVDALLISHSSANDR